MTSYIDSWNSGTIKVYTIVYGNIMQFANFKIEKIGVHKTKSNIFLLFKIIKVVANIL